MQVPTIKIKAKNKEGFIIINESDYDRNIHTRYTNRQPRESVNQSKKAVDKKSKEPESKEPESKQSTEKASKPATRNKEDNPFE